MRHSDKTSEFETGAHRDSDEGKGSPSLISPVLIHRLGILLAKGAEHYGADNWSKGMPYRRTADSMIRHMNQWLAGDKEEDHLAAIAFGVMCLMTYEAEVIPEGEGLNKLDDRDRRLANILPSLLTSPKPTPKVQCDERQEEPKIIAYSPGEPGDPNLPHIRRCRVCGTSTTIRDPQMTWDCPQLGCGVTNNVPR